MEEVMSLKTLEKGQQIDGDSGAPPDFPENFDLEKFNRGRRFYRNNVFSCSLAIFFSLIVGMIIPEFLNALIFTNQSNTPNKALKRYIATFHHVALWHYGNVWDKDSKAHKSVLTVRKMHKKVREQMEASRPTETDSRLFLSQYDMGVVQSGFMAICVNYPQNFGIVCCEEDLEAYVYFWYGIGHLLGIMKDYNICAHGLSNARALCRDIEDDAYKQFSSPPPKFVEMSSAVVVGFRNGSKLGILNVPTIISYVFACNKNLKPYFTLSYGDTVRFYFLKFLFLLVRKVPVVKLLLNKLIENVFGLVFTESDDEFDKSK